MCACDFVFAYVCMHTVMSVLQSYSMRVAEKVPVLLGVHYSYEGSG